MTIFFTVLMATLFLGVSQDFEVRPSSETSAKLPHSHDTKRRELKQHKKKTPWKPRITRVNTDVGEEYIGWIFKVKP